MFKCVHESIALGAYEPRDGPGPARYESSVAIRLYKLNLLLSRNN